MKRSNGVVPVAAAVVMAGMLAACGGTAQPPPTPRPSSTITGFGATVADWNASHIADADFAPGSVYNADPTLPSIDGHTGARYVTVRGSNGRITNYSMNLHAEPIAAARADVIREVPPDATVLWAQARDTCYQEVVTSATLAKALGSVQFGDTNGGVFFEFSTSKSGVLSAYDPNRVDQVIVNYGAVGGLTPTAAGAC
jgi:hypothetical protein